MDVEELFGLRDIYLGRLTIIILTGVLLLVLNSTTRSILTRPVFRFVVAVFRTVFKVVHFLVNVSARSVAFGVNLLRKKAGPGECQGAVGTYHGDSRGLNLLETIRAKDKEIYQLRRANADVVAEKSSLALDHAVILGENADLTGIVKSREEQLECADDMIYNLQRGICPSFTDSWDEKWCKYMCTEAEIPMSKVKLLEDLTSKEIKLAAETQQRWAAENKVKELEAEIAEGPTAVCDGLRSQLQKVRERLAARTSFTTQFRNERDEAVVEVKVLTLQKLEQAKENKRLHSCLRRADSERAAAEKSSERAWKLMERPKKENKALKAAAAKESAVRLSQDASTQTKRDKVIQTLAPVVVGASVYQSTEAQTQSEETIEAQAVTHRASGTVVTTRKESDHPQMVSLGTHTPKQAEIVHSEMASSGTQTVDLINHLHLQMVYWEGQTIEPVETIHSPDSHADLTVEKQIGTTQMVSEGTQTLEEAEFIQSPNTRGGMVVKDMIIRSDMVSSETQTMCPNEDIYLSDSQASTLIEQELVQAENVMSGMQAAEKSEIGTQDIDVNTGFEAFVAFEQNARDTEMVSVEAQTNDSPETPLWRKKGVTQVRASPSLTRSRNGRIHKMKVRDCPDKDFMQVMMDTHQSKLGFWHSQYITQSQTIEKLTAEKGVWLLEKEQLLAAKNKSENEVEAEIARVTDTFSRLQTTGDDGEIQMKDHISKEDESHRTIPCSLQKNTGLNKMWATNNVVQAHSELDHLTTHQIHLDVLQGAQNFTLNGVAAIGNTRDLLNFHSQPTKNAAQDMPMKDSFVAELENPGPFHRTKVVEGQQLMSNYENNERSAFKASLDRDAPSAQIYQPTVYRLCRRRAMLRKSQRKNSILLKKNKELLRVVKKKDDKIERFSTENNSLNRTVAILRPRNTELEKRSITTEASEAFWKGKAKRLESLIPQNVAEDTTSPRTLIQDNSSMNLDDSKPLAEEMATARKKFIKTRPPASPLVQPKRRVRPPTANFKSTLSDITTVTKPTLTKADNNNRTSVPSAESSPKKITSPVTAPHISRPASSIARTQTSPGPDVSMDIDDFTTSPVSQTAPPSTVKQTAHGIDTRMNIDDAVPPNIRSAVPISKSQTLLGADVPMIVDGTTSLLSQPARPSIETRKVPGANILMGSDNTTAPTSAALKTSSASLAKRRREVLPFSLKSDATMEISTKATPGASLTWATSERELGAETQISVAARTPNFRDGRVVEDLRREVVRAATCVNEIQALVQRYEPNLLLIDNAPPASIPILSASERTDGAFLHARLLAMGKHVKEIAIKLCGQNKVDWADDSYMIDIDWTHPHHKTLMGVQHQLYIFKEVLRSNYDLNDNWVSAYAELRKPKD